MYSLKNIMDRYRHEKKSLYIAFNDFKQAFDTIWHCRLLYKLLTSGISSKFYNIIKSMYCNTKVAVQDGDGLNISCLMYADNLIVISESYSGLQNAMDQLEDYCTSWSSGSMCQKLNL